MRASFPHLDSATLTLPAARSFARWDTNPLSHFWSQLSKRSFWQYVVANLEANHAASMPIYFRLAEA